MASVSTGAGRIRKYGLCKYWCWEEESMASVSTGVGRSRKYGLCKYWCWEDQKVWPL